MPASLPSFPCEARFGLRSSRAFHREIHRFIRFRDCLKPWNFISLPRHPPPTARHTPGAPVPRSQRGLRARLPQGSPSAPGAPLRARPPPPGTESHGPEPPSARRALGRVSDPRARERPRRHGRSEGRDMGKGWGSGKEGRGRGRGIRPGAPALTWAAPLPPPPPRTAPQPPPLTDFKQGSPVRTHQSAPGARPWRALIGLKRSRTRISRPRERRWRSACKARREM